MVMTEREAEQAKPKPTFNIKRAETLNAALRASFPAFLAVAVFSFFLNLLMLTGPLFMLQIYDRVLPSRSLPTLYILFALVAGLFVILGILDFVRARVLARIGAHVDQRINPRIFNAVMRRGLRTGEERSTTAPLQQLDTVQQFLSGPGLPALFDTPWVPVYILVIFLFHWYLGVLATVAAIMLFIIALLNDLRARKPLHEANFSRTEAGKIAHDGHRNAEVMTAMGMLGKLQQRWAEKHFEGLLHQTTARDRSGTLTAISKSLRLFFQSAILALGAALTVWGEITPGVMIAASIILGRALQPVEQAITHWRSFVAFRQARASLTKLLESDLSTDEKMALPAPDGKLEVRNLHITVPNTNRLILKNVNFNINPGHVLGIVGVNAAGKTTLARALVGARRQTVGDIRLDGATYDQWDPDILGRYIGYVPQDVELFGGKVSENIARFEPSPDPENIIRAAKQAGIDDMVRRLGGYDTDIGQEGKNLSEGQRQRIALARALYGEPPLVVLDEPNSNLDNDGEKALFESILGMRDRGQTVIIVSHRMNIIRLTDFLLELENGAQREFGPTDDILKRIRSRNLTKVKPGRISSDPIAANRPLAKEADDGKIETEPPAIKPDETARTLDQKPKPAIKQRANDND